MEDLKRTRVGRKLLPGRTNVTDLLLGESRVMCRWRSSLWKLLWRELLVYTITFLLISFIYRFALSEEQQFEFERLVKWSGKQYTGLPLTFLLGFYVSLVVKRWWEQYCKLPWPDNIAIYLRGLVTGPNDKGKIVRRTIIRYCILSYILCIRRLSVRLRKRFPTMKEVVQAGLVRPDEAARLGDEDTPEMYGSNWWMPLKWSVEIVNQAQKDGMVVSAPGYAGILGQISQFRSSLTSVATYGHIPVPLVYTQVVTLAVYVYFAVALIGEQWIIYRKPGDEIDLWYPIFMTVKFLFYFGWLRVAETLYNPFGEDDDDFELNELLNRHFKVALKIVSDDSDVPPLAKDAYWDIDEPQLYSEENFKTGSGQNMSVYTNGLDEILDETMLSSPDKCNDPVMMVEKRDPMFVSMS